MKEKDRLILQQRLVSAIGLTIGIRARARRNDPEIVEPLDKVLSLLADAYAALGFDPAFLENLGDPDAREGKHH